MPHIHTKPGQIDQTVTAYIVRYDEQGQPRLLMHMHKKLAKLLPPGGHVELDETWWQAVAHEVGEETGYDFANLKVLQPSQRIKSLPRSVLHPQPLLLNTHCFGNGLDHYHSDAVFAFVAAELPKQLPQSGESKDLRWLSREDIANDDSMLSDTQEVALAILDEFLNSYDQVATTDFSLELPKP